MGEPRLQPELDENLSRQLNPKTQTEIKGIKKFFGVLQTEDGRYAAVSAVFKMKDAEKITIFNHLEIEKEFAEENMMKYLTQVERFKRFI